MLQCGQHMMYTLHHFASAILWQAVGRLAFGGQATKGKTVFWRTILVFCSDDRKKQYAMYAAACSPNSLPFLSSCQVFRPQSSTVFHRSIIPKLGGWGILNLLRYANVDNVVGFSKPLKATSILQMNWTGRALDGPARRSTASSRSLTFQSRYTKQSLMGWWWNIWCGHASQLWTIVWRGTNVLSAWLWNSSIQNCPLLSFFNLCAGVHYRLCLDLDSAGALWAGDTGLEVPCGVSRCLKFQTGLIDARSIRSRIQNDTKRYKASRCQSVSCLSGTFRAVLGRSTLPASYPWRLRRFWSLPQRGWTWRQKPQPSGQAVWKITENNQFCLVRLIGDVKSK